MNYSSSPVRVVGFDVPALSSWPIEDRREVAAVLNCAPAPEWISIFNTEVGTAVAVIREGEPVVDGNLLLIFATPSTIGSLRVALGGFLLHVDSRLIDENRRHDDGSGGYEPNDSE
jgi:hypothetical protein